MVAAPEWQGCFDDIHLSQSAAESDCVVYATFLKYWQIIAKYTNLMKFIANKEKQGTIVSTTWVSTLLRCHF
jgi:hypothetical protein